MTPKIIAAMASCALAAVTVPAVAQAAVSARVSAITEQTANVGTRQSRYVRGGSGATTVVLLQGWPQSSHQWRVMPLLAGGFTGIAPDLPGIGGSTGPAGGAAAPVAAFEKAALARDIHAFGARLGPRRVLLIGHDIGGMVAYAYARLYPDELAGVTILDVPLPVIAPWDMVKEVLQGWHFGVNRQEPLAEVLVAGRQMAYLRYFIDSNAFDRSAIPDADVAAYAAAYRSPASLHAGFGFYCSFAADEAVNASHREPLDVPVLLAGADHSMGSGEAQLEQGLRALGLRNVRVAVITIRATGSPRNSPRSPPTSSRPSRPACANRR